MSRALRPSTGVSAFSLVWPSHRPVPSPRAHGVVRGSRGAAGEVSQRTSSAWRARGTGGPETPARWSPPAVPSEGPEGREKPLPPLLPDRGQLLGLCVPVSPHPDLGISIIRVPASPWPRPGLRPPPPGRPPRFALGSLCVPGPGLSGPRGPAGTSLLPGLRPRRRRPVGGFPCNGRWTRWGVGKANLKRPSSLLV